MNCQKCGAPAAPNVVTCHFCNSPVSAEAARSAIPCPQCRTLNAWGSQKCLKCGTWVVVMCIFCNNLSPYTMAACLTCNEPFAGAAQRKAQYDADIARDRNMQAASAVGGVAAPFLGAMAGAAIGSSFGHSHYDYWGPSWSGPSWGGSSVHHYHHYDYGPTYETDSFGGSTYDESLNASETSSYDNSSSCSSCSSDTGSSCSSCSSSD